jgi:hypothetical protein
MKYILIATKEDITKTKIYSSDETIPNDIKQLKLLGYSVKVYHGVDITNKIKY